MVNTVNLVSRQLQSHLCHLIHIHLFQEAQEATCPRLLLPWPEIWKEQRKSAITIFFILKIYGVYNIPKFREL